MTSKKLKRGLSVAAMLAAVALLAGCAGGGGGSDEGVTKLRLGHIFATTSSQNEGAQLFADLVSEKTDGEVQITVYPDSQLGGDEALGEDLARGALDLAFLNVGSMAGTDPLLDFHYLPYIATSYEQVDELMYSEEGVLRTTLEETLEKHKIVPIGMFELEWRALTNNSHPVEKPADLAGLKLRVPGSEAIRGFFDAAGAQTVVMPFPELLAGLEQRTIDGQDNGLQLTMDSGLDSSQKYVTLTNHVMAAGFISGSEKLWGSLTDEQKSAFEEAAAEAQASQVAASRATTADYLEKLRSEGKDVVELDAQQTAEFQNFGLELWDKFASVYGADRIAALRAEVDAINN